MASLTAYFDESFDTGGGVYSIAGYLGHDEMWHNVFTPTWKEVLHLAPHKLSEFKASDCRQLKGEFKESKGWTRAQCNDLTRAVISVLTESSPVSEIVGFGASVVFPGYTERKYRRAVEEYGFMACLHLAMREALRASEAFLGTQETVQVVCDEKPGFKAHVERNFQSVVKQLGDEMSLKALAPEFKDSKQIVPLQAADLLAYETRKETKSRLENPPRSLSKALESLVGRRFHRAQCIAWTKLVEARRRVREGLTCEDLQAKVLYESEKPWRGHEHWSRQDLTL